MQTLSRASLRASSSVCEVSCLLLHGGSRAFMHKKLVTREEKTDPSTAILTAPLYRDEAGIQPLTVRNRLFSSWSPSLCRYWRWWRKCLCSLLTSKWLEELSTSTAKWFLKQHYVENGILCNLAPPTVSKCSSRSGSVGRMTPFTLFKMILKLFVKLEKLNNVKLEMYFDSDERPLPQIPRRTKDKHNSGDGIRIVNPYIDQKKL